MTAALERAQAVLQREGGEIVVKVTRKMFAAGLDVDEIATIIDESLMGYAPGTYDQVRTGTWDAWNDSIDTHTIATEIVARLLGEQPT